MNLQAYISDLLYRYDCVIIPDFGAFLTKRISAQINKEQQTFYPPKKILSFNPQLQHNDGLLSSYIAEVEKIPFSDATAKIGQAVLEYRNELKANNSLVFEKIGRLQLGENGRLSFIPSESVNYLTSSFGLTHFNSDPVERIAHKEVVEELEEKAPIYLSKKSEGSYTWLKYAAAAVLILGLGGYGALQYHKSTVNTHNTLAQEEAHKAIEAKVQEATFVMSNPLPSAVLTVEKQVGNYHIVAGAFRIEANSKKKISQLKSLGYKARAIGVNRYGLHEVVYSSYETRAEAQKALREIRKSHNSDAWLLVKDLN